MNTNVYAIQSKQIISPIQLACYQTSGVYSFTILAHAHSGQTFAKLSPDFALKV